MPHDVMMPQLGMAQDADKIVSWLKSADDAITKGDALFEVETDKATMEVEAQADGFLTDVCAAEDDEVLVGAMIAHISNSAEDSVASPALDRAKDTGEDKGDSLPKGVSVTMPQLGVAQDTGLLVSWQKALGDPVAADDILFESRNWLCCTKPLKFEVPLSPDGFSPRPL